MDCTVHWSDESSPKKSDLYLKSKIFTFLYKYIFTFFAPDWQTGGRNNQMVVAHWSVDSSQKKASILINLTKDHTDIITYRVASLLKVIHCTTQSSIIIQYSYQSPRIAERVYTLFVQG